jgi:hypothetical protein
MILMSRMDNIGSIASYFNLSGAASAHNNNDQARAATEDRQSAAEQSEIILLSESIPSTIESTVTSKESEDIQETRKSSHKISRFFMTPSSQSSSTTIITNDDFSTCKEQLLHNVPSLESLTQVKVGLEATFATVENDLYTVEGSPATQSKSILHDENNSENQLSFSIISQQKTIPNIFQKFAATSSSQTNGSSNRSFKPTSTDTKPIIKITTENINKKKRGRSNIKVIILYHSI